MRFVLFTDKSTAQCMRDLNDRLEAKGTKSRPELDGWIKKGGTFSISVTLPVFGKFNRTTRLKAQSERESGVTVIRGSVSEGVTPKWQRIIFILLGLACALMLISGQGVLAIAAFVLGLATFIPMMGDYKNSDVLLIELERVLKASPKPPKNYTPKKR